MDKYTNNLSEEIKELIDAQENHWVAKWDDKMYYTHRSGLKLYLEDIQKRAEELEERCNKQWLKIQGDAEYITDLEAKLAESENCACKHICELTKIVTEKDRKIEELKQQLAEKQKEIESLTLAHFESETNKPVLTTTEIINQSKTEFAIQQLQRVKERYPRKTTMMWSSETEDGFEFPADFIDKIIKELERE